MRLSFTKPSRVDVILHPRDWRFRAWRWGFAFSFTGMYLPTGGAACSWHALKLLPSSRT